MRKLVTTQMMGIIEEVTGHGHNMTAQDGTATTISQDEQLYQDILNSRHELTDFDCYERVVKHFSKNCFSIAKVRYAQ